MPKGEDFCAASGLTSGYMDQLEKSLEEGIYHIQIFICDVRRESDDRMNVNSRRSGSLRRTRSRSQRSPVVGRTARFRGSCRKFQPRLLFMGSSTSFPSGSIGTTSSRASSSPSKNSRSRSHCASSTWVRMNRRSSSILSVKSGRIDADGRHSRLGNRESLRYSESACQTYGDVSSIQMGRAHQISGIGSACPQAGPPGAPRPLYRPVHSMLCH